VSDYAKVAPALDPEFVLFVERGGEPCAFLFGIPDLAARQRGESPALIAKTIAVLPEHRRHGIGTILLDELQAAALRKGYRELIHALQHETNQSLAITARLDHRVFRRYELLAKKL
jgi:GNAT superfamily N-acetyltransferase